MSRAKEALSNCDILVVFTGAGCSSDSGLPVFNQVPGYLELCSPVALAERPDQFYSFFRQAALRYAQTAPHVGYDVLRDLIQSKKEVLVATSNVDGALQKRFFSVLFFICSWFD